MSGNDSSRVTEQPSSAVERVITSRPNMRRSVSANVLSGDHAPPVDRPASAISPVASPVLARESVVPSSVTDYRARFEPIRTRHYVAQESALAAAFQNVAQLSDTGAASSSEQHSPAADATAFFDNEFHLPAASTPPEAAELFDLAQDLSQHTPVTPSLYGFVAQPQGPLAQHPQTLSATLGRPTSVSFAAGISQPADEPRALPTLVSTGLLTHPASISPASLSVNQTDSLATLQALNLDSNRSPNECTSLPATTFSARSMTALGPVASATLPRTQSAATSAAAINTSPLYVAPTTTLPAGSLFSSTLPIATPVLASAATMHPIATSQVTSAAPALPLQQTSNPVANTTSVANLLRQLCTNTSLAPQAQQAALFQQMMGMRHPVPQPVVAMNPAPLPAGQGAFTAEQQLSLQHIIASSIAQALACQTQAPPPLPVQPALVPHPPRHAPPSGMHTGQSSPGMSVTPSPSVQVAASSGKPSVQLGSGARFQYPLPAPLDPDPKALKWYSWEPSVRCFYETIGFPNIMDPSNAYTQSEHAQCIPFLLQMIPPADADYFVTERATYSTMDAIWSQLVKEYARHAKARVFALMRTFDSASQASGETIAEYVLRLNRLVKTLKTCRQGPNELNHKLKLLNVLPVLPGSDVQHTHFLGSLHTKLDTMSVSDLEQDLIDHESAIHRQQDTDILASQMKAVGTTSLFHTSAGTHAARLKYPLSRPPSGHKVQCCICWNDASEVVKQGYTGHSTRNCPRYNLPVGKQVCAWLDANPNNSKRSRPSPGGRKHKDRGGAHKHGVPK